MRLYVFITFHYIELVVSNLEIGLKCILESMRPFVPLIYLKNVISVFQTPKTHLVHELCSF